MEAFRRTREEAPDNAFGIAFDKTRKRYVWLLDYPYHFVQFVEYHMSGKTIGTRKGVIHENFIKNFKLIEKWK